MTNCYKCRSPFDPETASWCSCDAPLRTLRCATCGHCFCGAPMPYKRRFWADAPRHLRESPYRFRTQLAGGTGALACSVSRPTRQAGAPVPPSECRPVLLIVDDDEAMRSIVACFVEQLGYSALAIGDAQEALAMAAIHPFDVVITDALMPSLDGRELCRRLKAMPNGATKKVILMSSLYKSTRARLEAYQFGVDEFLPKPLNFNELATVLGRIAPIVAETAAIRTAV